MRPRSGRLATSNDASPSFSSDFSLLPIVRDQQPRIRIQYDLSAIIERQHWLFAHSCFAACSPQ